MKPSIIAFVIAFAFLAIDNASGHQVPCEKIVYDDWSYIGSLQVCEMRESTVIDLPRSVISTRTSSVKALRLQDNKKIFFLPEKVSESFPELLSYSADACSLTIVSKRNFKGLSKLRHLGLSLNQIKKIDSDTFEGLVSLEKIFLRKNFSLVHDEIVLN
jgi:hypothetical protein